MLKKSVYIFLTLWFAGTRISVAQTEKMAFSAADVTSDSGYLYQALVQTHYDLFAYTKKAEFDQAYATIRQSISADSLSLLATTKIYQKLAAISNTGHCEVDFPAASYGAYAREGGTIFPLELAFEDDKAYIRRSFIPNTDVVTGDVIISINTVPIEKIQREIHAYISAERPYFKNTKLEVYSFPRLYWLAFGEQQTFDIQTRNKAGLIKKHAIVAIPVMSYEKSRNGEIINANRSFRYLKNAAYLMPGPFSSARPDGEIRFRQFVDSVFTDLRTTNAQTLVLDLRNNAGGDNSYSDYLIAYFASRPFQWYSKFWVKTSALLKEHSRPHEGQTPDAFTQAILSHPDGAYYAYELPLQNPMPLAKRFTGKVLVLINRQSYSMAAVSAALIQDYDFGKLVGEETGDVPTLYGSQFAFALPKTGIVVKVPKGYFIRPNGSKKLAGVVPDYKVRDHLLDEEDEILTYTINNLLSAKTANKYLSHSFLR